MAKSTISPFNYSDKETTIRLIEELKEELIKHKTQTGKSLIRIINEAIALYLNVTIDWTKGEIVKNGTAEQNRE